MQIERIFKAHAADNPLLNEKLEEFLTLAAVVRCSLRFANAMICAVHMLAEL